MFDEFTFPLASKPHSQTSSSSIIDNQLHLLPSPILKPLLTSSNDSPSHHPIESPTTTPFSPLHLCQLLNLILYQLPHMFYPNLSMIEVMLHYPLTYILWLLVMKRGIFKPKAYAATDLSISEPTYIDKALNCNHWKAAMLDEYETLPKNKLSLL